VTWDPGHARLGNSWHSHPPVSSPAVSPAPLPPQLGHNLPRRARSQPLWPAPTCRRSAPTLCCNPATCSCRALVCFQSPSNLYSSLSTGRRRQLLSGWGVRDLKYHTFKVSAIQICNAHMQWFTMVESSLWDSRYAGKRILNTTTYVYTSITRSDSLCSLEVSIGRHL